MHCEVELQIITIQKFEIQTFVSLLKDTANEDGIAGIIVVARFSNFPPCRIPPNWQFLC